MTAENLKYHAKKAGYYMVKATNNNVADGAAVIAAAALLPFLAITSNITHDQMATEGLENRDAVMAEILEQKQDLLTLTEQYNELRAHQNAHEVLGNREESFAMASDIMKTEYDIRDAARGFFGNLYTNGDERGLAISETDFKDILTTVRARSGEFDWAKIDENIPRLITTKHVAEHLDESRAQFTVPQNADAQQLFNRAVEIGKQARADDRWQRDRIGLSVLGSLASGLFMLLLFGVYRDATRYIDKPKKPAPKRNH